MELMPDYASRVVGFGVFEVDLRAGELRRNGRKAKIQNQPFQILAMLLERPGEVVTREEMRTRLWPAETFVDFDHGLNSAVRRLRDALGDSAEKPTYVETLGRRGYRFIFPVERNGGSNTVLAPEAVHRTATVVPISVAPAQTTDSEPKTRSGAGVKVLLALACVIIVAALAYFWARASAVPTVSNYVQLTRDGRDKFIVGTDGSRLYLGLGLYGSQNIAEINVAGGDQRVIPTPPSTSMIPLSISENGAELLVLDAQGAPYHGKFWSLAVPGGAPRRLGDIEGRAGSWSPDGKVLAYSSGSDIFLAKADGTEPRKLASMKAPTEIDSLLWSPDGEHLTFQAAGPPAETGRLWGVSAKGGDPYPLIPNWRRASDWECCGRWTADGRYFVFMASNQIWALPRKGNILHRNPKPIQLTSSPMSLSCPVPSKDGKKLFVMGSTSRGELTRLEQKSGQLSPYLGGISAEFVDFSKDGQWVAYVSYPTGVLWRSKVDGSERLQLTNATDYALMPRWSPDGKRIVFYNMPSGKPSRIFEVSAEGGSPRPLMPDGSSHQVDPGWSPDGKKLVFSGASGDAASTIHIFDPTTKQVSTLAGSQGLFSPRWSPDGRYMAALAADSNTLHLFDFQNEKWIEVAKGTAGGFPNWSKDGQYIYIFGDNGKGVIKVRVSDRSVERVADLKSFAQTGLVGRSLALASDDSLLLLRDAGTQDVYALDWKTP
jgi:Tol biopolymer transport system component/DNA-binding winged helix-turn-helix (wHTH) protein